MPTESGVGRFFSSSFSVITNVPIIRRASRT